MDSCSTFTKVGEGFPFSFCFALQRSCMFCWRVVFCMAYYDFFTTLVEADWEGRECVLTGVINVIFVVAWIHSPA